MLKIFRKIASQSWFYYLIIVILVYLFFDFTKARYRRLNIIMDFSHYPIHNLRRGLTDTATQGDRNKGLRNAIKYYKLLSRAHPDIPRVYSMIGFCYFYLDDFVKAEKYYNKALSMDPEMFWVVFDLGVIQYRNHQYQKSIESFKKMETQMQKFSNQFPPLISKGRISAEVGENLGRLSKMLMIDMFESSQKLLLLSYQALKQESNVLEISKKSIKSNLVFDKSFFFYYAGDASLKLKKYEDSFMFLNASMKLDPDNWEGYEKMAQVAEYINKSFAREIQKKSDLLKKSGKNRRIKQPLVEPVLHPLIYFVPLGKEKFLQKQ